ncbi:hypothetical protein [uncultured Draconibacterium sp.]|uniref:hypothetical protein n=1 Tax=uncultured Draconibacterium sp. TaxID=1573823 RepID=UPI0025EE2749|nr:hypothetical protein [uncultured Draconibacterium sp.]
MTKQILLKTAASLHQPSKEAQNEFSQKLTSLVETMNKTMLNRSDIKNLVGKDNIEMMKDNHANHARFMESVFENYIPEVLVDTVLWVFRAYRSRNFSSTYWAAQLNTWITIYETELSENCNKQILPFYKWMQVNIPLFNQLAEAEIDAPLSSH